MLGHTCFPCVPVVADFLFLLHLPAPAAVLNLETEIFSFILPHPGHLFLEPHQE